MNTIVKVEPQTLAVRVVARHALGWLVAGNTVGVLLAALLLWPALNIPLAPLTYGRWLPLHLDWQLYGWCALPLVGILLAWCIDEGHPKAILHTRLALGAWSLALILGGVAWLGGLTSGKMFLEWQGWSRPLLPIAMAVLWTLLAAHVWWRRADLSRRALVARVLVLLVLILVPGALYWSAGRNVYPSVNPDSGGATGARLLASTLGIVAIYGFIAEVVGVTRGAVRAWYWGYFVFSVVICVGIEHGNASHHEQMQVLGLATLLGWLPLAWIYFGGVVQKPAARRWWCAAFAWWAALVASGLWAFSPGVSEQWKFTNVMVAHAHLAMAGLITSANLAVLMELRALKEPRGFWFWQSACVMHVAVLFVLGWSEDAHLTELFLSGVWPQTIYALRLATGVGMLIMSIEWLSTSVREGRHVQP
jgi:cytochrome c oxidase cbb3-type subunit 1